MEGEFGFVEPEPARRGPRRIGFQLRQRRTQSLISGIGALQAGKSRQQCPGMQLRPDQAGRGEAGAAFRVGEGGVVAAGGTGDHAVGAPCPRGQTDVAGPFTPGRGCRQVGSGSGQIVQVEGQVSQECREPADLPLDIDPVRSTGVGLEDGGEELADLAYFVEQDLRRVLGVVQRVVLDGCFNQVSRPDAPLRVGEQGEVE
ncbi:hypothetical protein ACIOEW_39010 [Streptomyces sp. NPDC087901]|uniref:hypothetical protein n=1 Tax=Streptomyces sp. NPDC087901 TaxID=3365818 RepID=UPI00382714CD